MTTLIRKCFFFCSKLKLDNHAIDFIWKKRLMNNFGNVTLTTFILPIIRSFLVGEISADISAEIPASGLVLLTISLS